jgi:hypothetical protein
VQPIGIISPRKEDKMSKKELSVFDKHQLRIAYSTLKMSEIGARIMGGMNHKEAREIIYKLTGKKVQ